MGSHRLKIQTDTPGVEAVGGVAGRPATLFTMTPTLGKTHEVLATHALTPKVPTVAQHTTVQQIERLLSAETENEFDSINYIYIVDQKAKLKGVVSVKEIFRHPKSTVISSIMNTDLVKISAHSHQEKAAILAIRHNIKAVPVIDRDDRFLGAITSDVILNILHSANLEDQLHYTGLRLLHPSPANFSDSSLWTQIKIRVPWLVFGLLGGILAASIVSGFDQVIEELVLLAAFLPAVVYIGDAVGAQTQMIIVRSLALDKNLSLSRYLSRELLISSLIGIILGSLTSLIALLFWDNSDLSLIAGVSFLLTIISSSMIAVLLPLIFNKLRIDPAIGSGPLATVIRDILSIMVYFLVASAILFY